MWICFRVYTSADALTRTNCSENPLSAYTYFVMEKRPQVSIESPKLSFGDVASKVGNMWRELSSEERTKYERMAREDKERYDKEKQSIQESYASINQDAVMGYHMQQMHHMNQNQQGKKSECSILKCHPIIEIQTPEKPVICLGSRWKNELNDRSDTHQDHEVD